jgi:hypothetical protein
MIAGHSRMRAGMRPLLRCRPHPLRLRPLLPHPLQQRPLLPHRLLPHPLQQRPLLLHLLLPHRLLAQHRASLMTKAKTAVAAEASKEATKGATNRGRPRHSKYLVMPANAGIQQDNEQFLDSRVRGNDK